MTPTKQELLDLIDDWEAAPNGFGTCDNLCDVADALGIEEGIYSADELREAIAAGSLLYDLL